jgi:hypothetical protein
MKYAIERPYADPEKAARRILEIANAVEPIQGRIHIEKINEPFLFRDRGSPPEYGAGLKLAMTAAGSRCTNPGLSSPSRRLALSCSPEQPVLTPSPYEARLWSRGKMAPARDVR